MYVIMLLQKLFQFMLLSGWVTTINGGEGGVGEGGVGEGGVGEGGVGEGGVGEGSVGEGGVGEGEARHFSLLSSGEKASVGKENSR